MKKLSRVKFNKKNLQIFLDVIDMVPTMSVTIDGDDVEFDLKSVLHYWGFYDVSLMKYILEHRLFILNENPSKEEIYDEYFRESLKYYTQRYYKTVVSGKVHSHEWRHAKITNEVIVRLKDLGMKHEILDYKTNEKNWFKRIFRIFVV